MPDLDERIRTYVDSAQPTVTMSEIKEHLSGSQPSGGPSRTSSRGRWWLGGTVAVVGVAALIAVLLTLPDTDPGKSSPASAAEVLRHTAMVADSQEPLVPGPGQFL